MKNKIKVSDLIIEFFESKGVSNIFLLSGGMMMHLLDSLSKSSKIKYICNHHEQASSFAAESFSRISGNIGVCFATSGPGSTNTITGITSAWVDSTPLMILTGQSRTSLTARGMGNNNIRMVGNFEVDIVEIIRPITKYAFFVDNPNAILYHLEKAYQLSKNGRPGPVLLDIPLDVQSAMINKDELLQYSLKIKPFFSSNNLKKVIDEINESKRPLLLAGHGIRVAKQVEAFRNMIESIKIPVVTTQLGNDVLPYENEMYIGKAGLRGDRAGNHAIQSADLIISLGSSLHITTTGYDLEHFAPNAKLINIDIDENNLSKNKSISEIQIQIEIKQFIETINISKIHSIDDSWRNELTNRKIDFAVIKEPHTVLKDTINTYLLVDYLSDISGENDIIIADSGSLYYIVGQAFKSKKNQRIIISGGLGTMGYALPAAIGAAFAEPQKKIICLVGDGSLHTNIHELSVIEHHNLNIKIIVINNKGYASIRNTQNAFMDGNIVASSDSTGVIYPIWKKICQSYSISHYTASKFSELVNLLGDEFNKTGPKFFEINIPSEVELIPAVVSVKNEDGSFTSSKLNEMSPKLS